MSEELGFDFDAHFGEKERGIVQLQKPDWETLTKLQRKEVMDHNKAIKKTQKKAEAEERAKQKKATENLDWVAQNDADPEMATTWPKVKGLSWENVFKTPGPLIQKTATEWKALTEPEKVFIHRYNQEMAGKKK